MRYFGNAEGDVRAMLDAIDVPSIDALFEAAVPGELLLDEPIEHPPVLSELELREHLEKRAARTLTPGAVPDFLGGGCYRHFVPTIVDHLTSRGEFLTAYTPYQAEASQGTLQAIFEFQTAIANLYGMELSNASLYDGATALVEALLLAHAVQRKRDRVILSGTIHPEYLQVALTYFNAYPLDVTILPPGDDGRTDARALSEALDDDVAAICFQNPNFFGVIEDGSALTEAAHAADALSVVSADPVSLGILAPPGDYNADIACGEGQGLGTPPSYGGPHLGLLATRDDYLRKLPGRVAGATTDRDGRRGYVLTLQTREQHIRRQKATSNICTNEALIALRALIHLSALGPEGMREVASLCLRKATWAKEQIAALDGFEVAHTAPTFKEFAIRCPRPAAEIVETLRRQEILGGIDLGRFQSDWADLLLIATTETTSRDAIERLVDALSDIA